MGSASVPAVLRWSYALTAVGWLILEVRRSRHRRPEATASDRGSRAFLQASYLLGLIAAAAVRVLAPDGDIHPIGLAAWLGLPVIWAGVALRQWSIRTLGRYFTFTVQTSSDQRVITTGPYRVIRHPSYTGLLCAFLGFGLVMGNWWSLLVLVGATTCGVVRRIMVEERALTAALGAPYRDYAATRRRLVPFVW